MKIKCLYFYIAATEDIFKMKSNTIYIMNMHTYICTLQYLLVYIHSFTLKLMDQLVTAFEEQSEKTE
jgi:hypothetical protein